MTGRWALAALLLAAAPATAAEHVVTMAGTSYTPDEIRARTGDVIRFVNDDDTDHEVFVPTVGFGVDLGKQAPGSEATLAIRKTGMFEVECVYHPEMLLTVSVVE